jgi:hypothetical protein
MAKWMSKKLAIWGENGSPTGVASAVSGSMVYTRLSFPTPITA